MLSYICGFITGAALMFVACFLWAYAAMHPYRELEAGDDRD